MRLYAKIQTILTLSVPITCYGQSVRDVEPVISTLDQANVDLVQGKVAIAVPLTGASISKNRLNITANIRSPNITVGLSSETAYDNFLLAINAAGLWDNLSTKITYSCYDHPYQNVICRGDLPGASGIWKSANYLDTVLPDNSRYKRGLGWTQLTMYTNSNQLPLFIVDKDGNKSFASNNFSTFHMADGEIWTYYTEHTQYSGDNIIVEGETTHTLSRSRLRSIVSNRGYAVQFNYLREEEPINNLTLIDWSALSKVTPYNKSYINCDESIRISCPSVFGASVGSVINYDSVNGKVRISPSSGEGPSLELAFARSAGKWKIAIASIRTVEVPGSEILFSYETNSSGDSGLFPMISSVTYDSATHTYEPIFVNEAPHLAGMTRTDPNGKSRIVYGAQMLGSLSHSIDELNRTTTYQSCCDGGYAIDRLVGVSYPSGNAVEYTRDERNNITGKSVIGADGIRTETYSATFDQLCINPISCNKPSTITDGNGNITQYAYDEQHGGLLYEIGPVVNGVSPSKRYSYVQNYAWTKAPGGGYVQSGAPIWVKTEERSCKSSTLDLVAGTCAAGAGDLIVKNYEYEQGNASTPSNIMLKGFAVSSGGQTLRTCYSYNAWGDPVSETSARAGLAVCP